MSQPGVVIIGAGPAGLFAALALVEAGIDPVTIVEQGGSLAERLAADKPDILTGWGGAGAFSDGKLTLSPEVGGFLSEIVPPERLSSALDQADAAWIRFGAPREVHAGTPAQVEELQARARLSGMAFIPSPIRHIGTETCRLLLAGIHDFLAPRCRIMTRTRAERIIATDGRAAGVELAGGEVVPAAAVICAPGRVGNHWVAAEAERLGLKFRPNPVDIGLRVECPAEVMRDLTEVFYESKLIYFTPTFDDKVRTFCMNPGGQVVAESAGDLITVNGHSFAGRKTANTNFALLVSATFTEPFDDPIAYARSIARLANLLGGGIIVQRWVDLTSGRRTTAQRLERCLTRPTLKEATPGDLSFVLPFRLLQDLTEMLLAMDKLTPGLAGQHTLLYGVEVKFYSHRVAVSADLETALPGLYLVGDGAGLTRGLLQASASGLLAAAAIAGKN